MTVSKFISFKNIKKVYLGVNKHLINSVQNARHLHLKSIVNYSNMADDCNSWPRVLSIQSHVISGYVGNKSATFPLQVLGFEVDAINSVQFSNHTAYGYWKGQVLDANELDDLADGLKHNGLDHYTHLLTGYVGSASFLSRIAALVKHLRERNPGLVYVCDPVMGDNGKMYVPPELLPIYRDTIVPLADIITPNQYEVELLTGHKINSTEAAWSAVQTFHDMGVKTVVLSSTELGSDSHLLGLASTVIGGQRSAWTIDIPRLPHSFTGTGDLFAALFLAWMSRTDNTVPTALEKTIATLQAVLMRTQRQWEGKEGVKHLELQLIQSKSDIENPEVVLRAKPLQVK